jgi:hypothetical protein
MTKRSAGTEGQDTRRKNRSEPDVHAARGSEITAAARRWWRETPEEFVERHSIPLIKSQTRGRRFSLVCPCPGSRSFFKQWRRIPTECEIIVGKRFGE